MSADQDHAGVERWKHDGVRVIKGDPLDDSTRQTPGMHRQAAVNHARVGAQKIWAGAVSIAADAKTGVHHHGELESVIYVVKGRARMRWGERLQYVVEAVVVNITDVEPVEKPDDVYWVDPIHKAP
jgi:uncharacterized RmlC-like cupin family protein